jgi:hypothetical protein
VEPNGRNPCWIKFENGALIIFLLVHFVIPCRQVTLATCHLSLPGADCLLVLYVDLQIVPISLITFLTWTIATPTYLNFVTISVNQNNSFIVKTFSFYIIMLHVSAITAIIRLILHNSMQRTVSCIGVWTIVSNVAKCCVYHRIFLKLNRNFRIMLLRESKYVIIVWETQHLTTLLTTVQRAQRGNRVIAPLFL